MTALAATPQEVQHSTRPATLLIPGGGPNVFVGLPGEFRSPSIPTVADRVVMTAAKLVLEPDFEVRFTEASDGFRPKRSAIDACEAVRVTANQGRDWVFEADIRDCFGTIGHDALINEVARRVSDRSMLKPAGQHRAARAG